MPPSTYYAVLLALVLGVGCGDGKEKAAPKAEAKVKATPKVKPKGDATPKAEPKAETKKPLTKAESAKVIEAAIRKAAKKPTGELTKADLEKVTELRLHNNQLTSVKGLENLTQLTRLGLENNQLTSVKGLENLTQLTYLILNHNPDLTKAQIDELKMALPKCKIFSDF